MSKQRDYDIHTNESETSAGRCVPENDADALFEFFVRTPEWYRQFRAWGGGVNSSKNTFINICQATL